MRMLWCIDNFTDVSLLASRIRSQSPSREAAQQVVGNNKLLNLTRILVATSIISVANYRQSLGLWTAGDE